MGTFAGMMPGVDAYGVVPGLAFKVNVVNTTVDRTILASESGTFFVNLADTGGVTYTLPAVADGLNYHFFQAVDFDMEIVGATNLTIADDDVTATSISMETASNLIGNCIYAVSDGVKWILLPAIDEGATVTVT